MKRFNFKYNTDETVGTGKGYYLFFENNEGKATIDCMYPTWKHNETVDGISVGFLNRFRYLEALGYKYDRNFIVNLKELF